jgi:sec-independent protein translocase protein TatA
VQAVAETVVMLALFNLGGGAIILILLLVLILFGSRKLPELGRGLRRGIFEFREATEQVTKEVTDAIDEEASEAGRSVGGIYGKAAAQALTPDNQVAELYNPGRPEDETQPRKRCKAVIKGFMKLWWCLRRFVRAILGASDR